MTTNLRMCWMLAVCLILGGGIGQAWAEDGADIYKARGCDSCHGENGGHPITPDYPVLAGQNARYLLRQMIDIRDGARANGLSASMKPVIAGVTDEELATIAEWLSHQY
jgi:cytochrome c